MFLNRQSREEMKERSFLPAAAESVLLPAFCLMLCLWLRPKDPFFLAAPFPWIWLVPILAALRYGSAAALIASLTLAAGWSLTAARGMDFPRGFFLGGFITTFLCGEFRDLGLAEVRKERKTREHLGLRLDELGRAHHVLAESHERLMTDFIGHPPTLRDALAEIPRAASGRLDAESAQALLVFLARFFQLETAALHLMEEDGLRADPIAALGHARRLDGREKLIAACLETRSLCHALEDAGAPAPPGAPAPAGAPGPYLFAAPVAAVGGPILAVLAVEKMPFFAFQEENLRGLFAALGYYADTLAAGALAAQVIAKAPDCPPEFAAGYLRLHRLQATSGVPGVLAARIAPAGSEGEIPAPRRGADLTWRREAQDGSIALILLMPFCGEEQARAALARLPGGPGRTQVKALTRNEPVRELSDFLASLEASVDLAPRMATGRKP
ncbi:MAG: hypothetical protein JF616_19615 [Fibrobacteres bacterium]|nr:hypothetical protein [Fibrobacterota bacterium]